MREFLACYFTIPHSPRSLRHRILNQSFRFRSHTSKLDNIPTHLVAHIKNNFFQEMVAASIHIACIPRSQHQLLSTRVGEKRRDKNHMYLRNLGQQHTVTREKDFSVYAERRQAYDYVAASRYVPRKPLIHIPAINLIWM